MKSFFFSYVEAKENKVTFLLINPLEVLVIGGK